MRNNVDELLDEEHWRVEAQAVINDVKMHVQNIKVSERLTSTNKVIYLNLTTLEGLRLCVELSASGFTIVGNRYDDVSNTNNEHFETPYSLLEYVSPRYRESFGLSLLNKLKDLKNQQ
ncbi:GSK3-beta interaction protein-like [Odontomachus brunneus]|uniref:GSK3-beta interaction protein-like n=1 Tax=Odontomachus brunneus TaxID=486640 RepID=UPI0013F27F60|nr:GSK3-beta interaction protein-like [Odontomachus brunneus]